MVEDRLTDAQVEEIIQLFRDAGLPQPEGEEDEMEEEGDYEEEVCGEGEGGEEGGEAAAAAPEEEAAAAAPEEEAAAAPAEDMVEDG